MESGPNKPFILSSKVREMLDKNGGTTEVRSWTPSLRAFDDIDARKIFKLNQLTTRSEN